MREMFYLRGREHLPQFSTFGGPYILERRGCLVLMPRLLGCSETLLCMYLGHWTLLVVQLTWIFGNVQIY